MKTTTTCEACDGLGVDLDGRPCTSCATDGGDPSITPSNEHFVIGGSQGASSSNGQAIPPLPPPPEHPPDETPSRPRMPTVPRTTPGTLGSLAVRKASEITATTVRWLWDGRLAYAKLNVLGGPPGVGKSYLTLSIAAAVSTGSELPGDPRRDARPSRVLLLSYEDDPEDTLRPRLDRLDADLDRVEIIEGVETDDRRRAFGPEDVALLADHAEQTGDVALVVVDPVSAFVGSGVDEHRANEVRHALEDLRVQAQDHGFAVLIVMHTRKSTADTALNRLAGSQAYGALVRSALMAGPIPDDEADRHALAHVKHNLAAKQPTLAYAVNEHGLTWHGEIDLDPEEVAGHADTSERSASGEAAAFLTDLLADGPVPAKTVLREAADAGIAERTLHRAKKQLGATSERRDGAWSWTLPAPPRLPRLPNPAPGNVGNVGEDEPPTRATQATERSRP